MQDPSSLQRVFKWCFKGVCASFSRPCENGQNACKISVFRCHTGQKLNLQQPQLNFCIKKGRSKPPFVKAKLKQIVFFIFRPLNVTHAKSAKSVFCFCIFLFYALKMFPLFPLFLHPNTSPHVLVGKSWSVGPVSGHFSGGDHRADQLECSVYRRTDSHQESCRLPCRGNTGQLARERLYLLDRTNR